MAVSRPEKEAGTNSKDNFRHTLHPKGAANMAVVQSIGRIFFVWSAKLTAFALVSVILFFCGLIFVIPGIGLVISVYTLQWLLNTRIGVLLRNYFAYLIQIYFPLPPGNYVSLSDDYGRRVGMNLKKLRESRAKTGFHGRPMQSVSAGGVGEHSILNSRAGASMEDEDDLGEFSSDEDAILLSEAPKHTHKPRNGSYSMPIKSSNGHLTHSGPDDEENGDFDVLIAHQPTSPTRMSSNPIQIENSGRTHLRDSGQIPFPLTDGALAEYSALSSTPLSNSSMPF